ncbi:hypothetical protein DFP72DRAFT_850184 [Ephemerocybe angulata]|uniref:Uncharacterized protein n=1 Tax=Ephemerocybe angulata TaxID=980116 RepID=A0A8H6HRT3_9AGAR|nr:hypothetical protein DFP72DRAFT_850184 [Tulosesus angulatus]
MPARLLALLVPPGLRSTRSRTTAPPAPTATGIADPSRKHIVRPYPRSAAAAAHVLAQSLLARTMFNITSAPIFPRPTAKHDLNTRPTSRYTPICAVRRSQARPTKRTEQGPHEQLFFRDGINGPDLCLADMRGALPRILLLTWNAFFSPTCTLGSTSQSECLMQPLFGFLDLLVMKFGLSFLNPVFIIWVSSPLVAVLESTEYDWFVGITLAIAVGILGASVVLANRPSQSDTFWAR